MTEQRSVLISGCSTGIGRCVAEGLKGRGYRVFATARKQNDVEELISLGFEAVQLDLASSASIRSAVEYALQKTGGVLYALFNNGAYGQPGAVEDLSRDVLREQFEVNLFGAHELANLVIPVMRRQGEGRIIQNSSLLGLVALKYRGAYNATKYALEGLTDTLRMELKGTNIYVSLIEPGPIRSNFRQNSYAAYKRNINKENSYYKEVYELTGKRLQTEGPVVPFTLGPEAVLKKVIHALESRRPKERYYVTFPTHLFAYLKRILPVRVLDKILEKI
ncbi:MAG: oxidoreductase [Gammaproteobacteria bacterium]|nr:oxidoreductase [Gammaproteobacteria bacterium]